MIRITKRNPVVVVVGRVVAITFIKCIKPENVTNCMIHAVYVPGLYVDYKKKKNMSQWGSVNISEMMAILSQILTKILLCV